MASPASESSSSSSSMSTSSSPIHHASLVDPALHNPALLELIDVKVSKQVIEYTIDVVVETVDYALGRSSPSTSRGRAPARRPEHAKFADFVNKVITRAEVTMSTLLACLAYIDRARPHLHIGMEEWALERVFLGALIVASKYLNDSTLKNVHWAMCTSVFGKRDVGRIEREFLDVLNFELKISEDDLLSHHQGLTQAVSLSSRHIQRTPSQVKLREIEIPSYSPTSSSSSSSTSSTSTSATSQSSATSKSSSSTSYSQPPPPVHTHTERRHSRRHPTPVISTSSVPVPELSPSSPISSSASSSSSSSSSSPRTPESDEMEMDLDSMDIDGASPLPATSPSKPPATSTSSSRHAFHLPLPGRHHRHPGQQQQQQQQQGNNQTTTARKMMNAAAAAQYSTIELLRSFPIPRMSTA